VDPEDKFCRNCGVPLTDARGTRYGVFRPAFPYSANAWQQFFRPFFKMAFIFFGCFFGFATLLMIFWYFTFHR